MEIGVCDACFVISGVVGRVEVVGGVSGAEEVAFAIFRVLEGVRVPATAAQLGFGIAEEVDAGGLGGVLLAAEMASFKKKKNGVW